MCTPIKCLTFCVLVGLLPFLDGCVVVPQEGTGTGSATATYPYPSATSNNINNLKYHTVAQGETLAGIARQYGTTYQELARWNNIPAPYIISPGQQLSLFPPSEGTYGSLSVDTAHSYPVEQISPGKKQSTIRSTPLSSGDFAVAKAKPKRKPKTATYHSVKVGETLYTIAGQYGKDFRDLAQWNNLEPPFPLEEGQRLRLTDPGSTTKKSSSIQTAAGDGTVENYHVVQAGESLYGIARLYGQTAEQVAQWNGLVEPYTLEVGQSLRVTGSSSSSTNKALSKGSSQEVVSGKRYHTVGAGETLYSISRRYGQTVEKVASWNGLKAPYTLEVGQSLMVSSSAANTNTGSGTLKKSSTTARNRSKATFHSVKSGETLQSIAAQYGMTRKELALWNGIGSPYTVYPGQRLMIIPPP